MNKWQGNGGECPFVELKNYNSSSINNAFDYELLGNDKTSPLGMLYNDKYI
ncbi:hypothetical protein LGK95_02505 [Clostridium algoriphilum]|uniref:hypothetical protein n=1 Tax=Clostridium algoriphilum TaxID=198347 RepID=UPI001CF5B661|nr:hypothetical protein [Clostridium algoriphilum]MCB2292410.1 hypothetical protein [Clostridium algoriphilum]